MTVESHTEPASPRFPEADFAAWLPTLSALRGRVEPLRETILGNLIMISEIPAPTMEEGARAAFLSQRMSEVGLLNTCTDETGNAVGILPGRGGANRHILVSAHLDTVFPASEDHTVTVRPDSVSGRGVADNALGLAVLVTLPEILERLDVHLDANIIFLGAARSLGRGNLDGLRFFLEHNRLPIEAGLCLEGVQLGRLNLNALGTVRGEIVCRVPEEYDWTRFGARGAIMTLNEVINKMLGIPLTRSPRTDIVFGSLRAGSTYHTVTTESRLRFEVRGESAELVDKAAARIQEICDEVAAETDAEVRLDIAARTRPGGLAFSHPLARRARRIIQALDIVVRTDPTASALSLFSERGIPALTVGLSTGTAVGQPTENVAIEPVFTGIAQTIGMLHVMDRGYDDDD